MVNSSNQKSGHQQNIRKRQSARFMVPLLCSMLLVACTSTSLKEPPRPVKPVSSSVAKPLPNNPATKVAAAPIVPAAVAIPVAKNAPPNPVAASKKSPTTRTVAVILPTQSKAFKTAAEAVQAGIYAAIERSAEPWQVQLLETDDSTQQAADAFARAQTGEASVVIGPLPRNAVNAAVGVAMARPTVLLNLPENLSQLTGPVLAFSMALDAQARHVASASLSELGPRMGGRKPRALLIQNAAANTQTLSRRIGTGFAQQFIIQGGSVETLDTTSTTASRLPERIKNLNLDFDLVFLALDAPLARTVKPFLPRELPAWGTAQLVSGAPIEIAQLNELHFADMPWILSPDSPAVMSYSRPNLFDENLRWYAFGIDAFRLAVELAEGNKNIDLDGVTGRLRAGGKAGAIVERIPVIGVIRNGTPVLEGPALLAP